MGMRLYVPWRPFLCISLLMTLGVSQIAWSVEGPPVPGQTLMDMGTDLIPVESVLVSGGQLKIRAKAGVPLVIKEPFILQNPSRLVIDVVGVKLGSVGLPFPPETIGNVPIRTIRFGQLDMETMRVVVETDEPERLQVAVQQSQLVVFSSKTTGLFSQVARYLLGRPQSQPPPEVAKSPRPLSPPLPPVAVGSPVLTPSSSSPTTRPVFANLQKLQAQSAYRLGAPQREHIMSIARSQLGLSKDTDRDYVNQTFSQGRDNNWCADFVSTVLEWAGGSPWGHLSRVQDIYDWGVANHRLNTAPQPADVVVLSYGGTGFDHVALVESVNPDNTVTTIGGNEGYAASSYRTSGSVARSIYKLDDKRIIGFVDPVAPKGISSDLPP